MENAISDPLTSPLFQTVQKQAASSEKPAKAKQKKVEPQVSETQSQAEPENDFNDLPAPDDNADLQDNLHEQEGETFTETTSESQPQSSQAQTETQKVYTETIPTPTPTFNVATDDKTPYLVNEVIETLKRVSDWYYTNRVCINEMPFQAEYAKGTIEKKHVDIIQHINKQVVEKLTMSPKRQKNLSDLLDAAMKSSNINTSNPWTAFLLAIGVEFLSMQSTASKLSKEIETYVSQAFAEKGIQMPKKEPLNLKKVIKETFNFNL